MERTARPRSCFSAPLVAAQMCGLIRPGVSVFDYGCGLGDEVRLLRAAGIEAAGWDPAHAPDAPLLEVDVVNLGFVLNVVEGEEARREVLRSAFALARVALIVSVRVDSLIPGEGAVNSVGSFQQRFSAGALRRLVLSSLGPVVYRARARGTGYVFRSADDADRYVGPASAAGSTSPLASDSSDALLQRLLLLPQVGRFRRRSGA